MLEDLKNDLIALRDSALKAGEMSWAVNLSHYIAAINTGAIIQAHEYTPSPN